MTTLNNTAQESIYTGLSSSSSSVPSTADFNVHQYAPETPVEEVAPKQPFFPRSHIIEVTLSEPRDVLQSERTFLTFIRFSVSLYFTAIGMILGFRLRSSGVPVREGEHTGFNSTLFNHVMSFFLIFLAFATLLVSTLIYFKTVRRYSQKRIHTNAVSNSFMVVCVSAIVITLVAINISMIVERVMQER